MALVLSVLETPVMDSFTLARHIRQDQRFKGIPVVIPSSLTGTAYEAHVSAVGANDHGAQFVTNEVVATIRLVLRH